MKHLGQVGQHGEAYAACGAAGWKHYTWRADGVECPACLVELDRALEAGIVVVGEWGFVVGGPAALVDEAREVGAGGAS